MLGLPKATELKRQLSKNAIYRKFKLDTAAREHFDADISRIDIVNEVSPSNSTLAPGETVKAFFVLLVTLKRMDIDEKNIALLSRLINQNLLFVLTLAGKARLAVFRGRLLQSDWRDMDALAVSLTGLDMDAVWENVVIQVGGLTIAPGRTLDEQLLWDAERDKLQKQIDLLTKKAWAERQPKRKFELAQQIQTLKGQQNRSY